MCQCEAPHEATPSAAPLGVYPVPLLAAKRQQRFYLLRSSRSQAVPFRSAQKLRETNGAATQSCSIVRPSESPLNLRTRTGCSPSQYLVTKAVYNFTLHQLAKHPGRKTWIISRTPYLVCLNVGQLPFRVKSCTTSTDQWFESRPTNFPLRPSRLEGHLQQSRPMRGFARRWLQRILKRASKISSPQSARFWTSC
jgi:hypothetical protein